MEIYFSPLTLLSSSVSAENKEEFQVEHLTNQRCIITEFELSFEFIGVQAWLPVGLLTFVVLVLEILFV